MDRVADVVVIGSGAAGLAAASVAASSGAEVIVIEKTDLLGGTTGFSGGVCWIPCNEHMRAAGIPDDRQNALTYVRALTEGREPSPELLEAFVDRAAEAMSYLEAKTSLRMQMPTMTSDYHAELPGGAMAGRTIEPVPFPARELLGDWAKLLRVNPRAPVELTFGEGEALMAARDEGTDPGFAPREVISQRREDGVVTNGPAMIGAFLHGLLKTGATILLNARAHELVVSDGSVTGVRVKSESGTEMIGARGGVVVASGGFEWNEELVRQFIGHELLPASPPACEGDGLVMGMRAGAALAGMTSYWGYPMHRDPTLQHDGRPRHEMAITRSAPGSLIVNADGRRFVNEGVTYQDFAKVLNTFDPVRGLHPNKHPVWFIFDASVRERERICQAVQPGKPDPAWLHRADTIEELATLIDLDPLALAATVSRFNEGAAIGEDPEFGRGTAWWEGFTRGGPDPSRTLAPLVRAPFFALAVYDGAFATSGGLLTDGNARVRRAGGGVIAGLYAAGNVSTCAYGDVYPGAGGTIGPAVTFGYLAGQHAAARARENARAGAQLGA